jgi:excisionase family DNA binding protein
MLRAIRQPWRHDIQRIRRDREPGVLTGVRNICKYMGIGIQTFYRLHQQHGLPAMKLPGGRWSTSKNLIDGWIVAQWKAQTGRNTGQTAGG